MYLVNTGMFKKERWKDLAIEIEKLGQASLFIDDSTALSITEIRVRARRLASELAKQGKELGLIVIDYMQLIRGTGKKTESRQQEVSETSRMLKALARDLNVPVMALSQLNRNSESKGRTDNKPQLSDLRESGSIEQDADVVMFIHRERKKQQDGEAEPVQDAKIIVAKQRNGPIGDVPLLFLNSITRFESKTNENE